MKSSFIITIFLLLTCIVLSQSTEYYLNCIIEESDKLIEPYVRNKPKNNQPKNNQPKNSKPKSIVQASKSIAKTYVPAPTTPPPVVVETTPNIIKKYLSDIKNANFLSTAQLQNIYGSIDYAMKQKSISNIDEMNKYLVFLQEKLNGIDSPPLNQIIYFCVSLPYAFNKFFMPDQKIPVPYNKLYATMSNIFQDIIHKYKSYVFNGNNVCYYLFLAVI